MGGGGSLAHHVGAPHARHTAHSCCCVPSTKGVCPWPRLCLPPKGHSLGHQSLEHGCVQRYTQMHSPEPQDDCSSARKDELDETEGQSTKNWVGVVGGGDDTKCEGFEQGPSGRGMPDVGGGAVAGQGRGRAGIGEQIG